MTWLQDEKIKPFQPNTDQVMGNDDGIIFKNTMRAVVQETLGSFIFVFFYLALTEKRTMERSKEKAINCLLIAASFVLARAMFFG